MIVAIFSPHFNTFHMSLPFKRLYIKLAIALTTWGFSLAGLAQQNWQAGDMIFRTGTEPVSNAVMLADTSGYSHVGMLVGKPGHWQVVHATPEEETGKGNAVVLDELAFFIAPERAIQHKVYHVQATQAQRETATQWALAQLGKPFTMLDPNGVYCTTLIWKAWMNAGVDLQVSFKEVHLPMLSDTKLLFPSSLMRSPWVTPAQH